MEEHRLALTPGYQIEHFRIEAILGKGGFGITYVALDLQLGKRVAIKELLPDSIATRIDGTTVVPQSASLQENWEWARERFLDEARVLAGFSHPAIVGVHRLIEANGTVYMVMDYVQGESLEARLRRGGQETDQAALMAILFPIFEGMSEVHAKGLLHRDIKPENILINLRGQPVLIDFGSARSAVGATMTMTSIVTHGYSPIEQYQTKGRMGPWTDIYALGAVMCRAMTGEKPPVAADRLMDDEFEWLSYRKVPGFSERFLQVVDWALRVRPEERPESIETWVSSFGEIGETLDNSSASVVDGEAAVSPNAPVETISEQNIHIPQRLKPANRESKPILIAVIVAVVLVISLFGIGAVIQTKQSEKKAIAVKNEAAQKAAEEQRLASEVESAKAAADKAAADKAAADKAAEQQRIASEAASTKAAADKAEAEKVAEQQRIAREAESAKAAADQAAAARAETEEPSTVTLLPYSYFGPPYAGRVAFVDMNRIFTSYYKTKAAEDQLNVERAKAKIELDAKLGTLKKAMDDINSLNAALENVTLSDPAKQRTIQLRDEKVEWARNFDRAITDFRTNREKTLQDSFTAKRKVILDEIMPIVNNICIKNRYDFVFDKSGMSMGQIPVVIRSGIDTDFSNEVIAALNSRSR